MDQVSLDPSQLTRLLGAKGPVQVTDSEGRVVGVFAPIRAEIGTLTPDAARRLFDLDKAKETLARERDLGRPLAEIWARLEAQEKGG